MLKFKKGDWNGFWALFADNLANMVISSGILIGVFKFPEKLVFGKILPGIGVSLIFGLGIYAWFATILKRKTGRQDVTALPYGISTPVMFVYIFSVMGPVYFKTQDPIMAYRAGIGAAFIGGIIEMLGSVIGPFLRRITPRAGMLGTLAGIALTWIAVVPMGIIFENPLIGLPALFVILFGLIGGYRLPIGIPAGLGAIIVGTMAGFFSGQSAILTSTSGIAIPLPYFGDLAAGIITVIKNPSILAVVIPIEIYNFIETMNNVESAAAAGDEYPTGKCQIVDGLGTCIGALFGSPFPTTVYIGHPAYKRLGAGVMYALAVGIFFFVASTLGIISIFRALIPEAAVAPLLVFVGVVITHQAFKTTPPGHGVAIAFALIPHIADLLSKQIINLVGTITGCPLWLYEKTDLVKTITDQCGVHISGYTILSQGAIITGLLWGAIVAFILDGKLLKAAGFSLCAFFLTLIGIIHRDTMSFVWSPITTGYLFITLALALSHFYKLKKEEGLGEL